MMNLMTDMAKTWNQTMVIVTHDNEISGYASRIINIRDGKIERLRMEGICMMKKNDA